MTPDPEHRLPPGVLAGLLREQLEVCSVLADRISVAGQLAAAGRSGIEEVQEAEDTVRWLRRLTRTILGRPEAGSEQEPARAEVSAAARRTVRRWARTMPDLDVSVEVDRGTWVAVAPTILERILQGLLATAARSARRGVRLVASRTAGEVELRTEGGDPLADQGSEGGDEPSASDREVSDREVEVLRWLVERSGGSVDVVGGGGGAGGGMGVRLPAETQPGGRDRGEAR